MHATLIPHSIFIRLRPSSTLIYGIPCDLWPTPSGVTRALSCVSVSFYHLVWHPLVSYILLLISLALLRLVFFFIPLSDRCFPLKPLSYHYLDLCGYSFLSRLSSFLFFL